MGWLRKFLSRMWSPARSTPPTEAELLRAELAHWIELREQFAEGTEKRAEIEEAIAALRHKETLRFWENVNLP